MNRFSLALYFDYPSSLARESARVVKALEDVVGWGGVCPSGFVEGGC